MADGFKGDLLDGVKSIADYLGIEERTAYHLARKGSLPGVFQSGRKWLALKYELESGLRARAKGAQSSSKIEERA